MSFETAAVTDVGRVRDVNEDAAAVHETDDWCLVVVADGMGGHAAGDVASEAAVSAFLDHVEAGLDRGGDPEAVLSTGATAANEHLHELVAEDPSLDGMGTTLVAALVRESTATFVNVGDSRGYLVGESVEQVTVDHSLVQELVDSGDLTPEEAAEHPQRNVVSQSLGTDESVDPDTFTVSLDGWALVCSDGLTEEVAEDTVDAVCRDADDPETAAANLVERANENGGSDNVSVAIAGER